MDCLDLRTLRDFGFAGVARVGENAQTTNMTGVDLPISSVDNSMLNADLDSDMSNDM